MPYNYHKYPINDDLSTAAYIIVILQISDPEEERHKYRRVVFTILTRYLSDQVTNLMDI